MTQILERMKKETLDYYLSLEYKIIIQSESEDNEKWFIAYCDELGKYACYGQGNTPSEAVESYNIEKDIFIESLYFDNKNIPEPLKEDDSVTSSGVFNVRTTPDLHNLLLKQALKNGVSLNKYINTILSYNAGLFNSSLYVNQRLDTIEQKIDKHHSYVTDNLNYQFTHSETHISRSTEVLKYQEESEYFTNIKKAS